MFAKALVLASALVLTSSAFGAEIRSPIQPVAFGLVVCYARNAHGVRFSATGLIASIVQQRALANCRAAGSAACFADGCK